MIPQNPGEEPESLRDLAARVIEDGKTYLKAELTLAKEQTVTRLKQAGPPIGLLVVALMIGQAAITVLAVSAGLLLTRWLGWPGGFLAAALLMMGVMLLIAWIAAQRIRKIVR